MAKATKIKGTNHYVDEHGNIFIYVDEYGSKKKRRHILNGNEV